MELDGGDNISSDFGKTSKFHVCSDTRQNYPVNKVIGNETVKHFKLYYCLSGTVKKDSQQIIEGNLTLNAVYEYETGEGTFGIKSEGSVSLKYKVQK